VVEHHLVDEHPVYSGCCVRRSCRVGLPEEGRQMKNWAIVLVTLLAVAFLAALVYLGFLMLTGPRM